jgi:hypothetical protein
MAANGPKTACRIFITVEPLKPTRRGKLFPKVVQ